MSANRGGAGAALAWVVSALVLLAFAVRVYHLDYQSLWRDEVDALIFATRDLGTVLGNFTKVGENGPLYFLLLRLWVAASGTGEFSLRFFSAIFGVLIVPLAYAFGRRLVGREVGLFAALLVGVSPYSVWYAQEARMYALLAFMSLLSVAVYFRALEGGRPNPPAPFPPREGGAAERPTAAATTPLTVAGRGRGRGFPPRLLWPTYVVVTGLSLYVHFFAALVVLFEELLFVAGWARWRSAFRPWAMAFGLLVLPYLPLAAWQLPTILQPPPTAYPFLDPASIVAVLIRAWSLGFSPLPALVPLTVFVFLLLAGLVLYPARRGSFWFLVSGVWSKWCCPARVRGQASAAGSLPSAASRSPAEPAGSSPVVLSRCESIAGSAGSQSVMLSRSEASPRLEQATSGRCFAAAQHDNGGATRRVTGVPDARAAAQHDQAGIPPITHHSSLITHHSPAAAQHDSGGASRPATDLPDASHCETGTANPVYVLAMYLFTPILGFYLLSLRLPLFADRYLIVASPAFYLLLACGLAAVRRRSAAVFGLCLVVVLGSSISSIWAQAHTTIKADFRSAARYFAERTDGREPVVFVIPYAQHTFSYYYRASLAVRQAPYTNGGLPPEQVAARLRAELGGEQRVWVILSEEETYDAHALARAWLDGNGRPAESERFVGVALYRYEVRLQ